MNRALLPGDAIHFFLLTCAAALAMFSASPASAQAPSAPMEPAAWEAQTVTDTIAGDAKLTRFVVGIERPVQPIVQTFNQRVVIDFPETRMQLPPPTDRPVGLIQNFSGGLSGPGRARVILEVLQPVVAEARVETARDGKTHRLIIEIGPADKARSAARRSLPKPAGLGAAGVEPPKPRPVTAKARPNTYKPTIVLDPGHGGQDSGAIKHGTVEKEVVLAFSLALRDKLNATGRYNVLMTRETDVFVPLDERRAFAERNGAQLFIAVHADYASTQARGATIYTLRDGKFNSLKRSAKSQVADVAIPEAQKAVHRQIGENSQAVAAILGDLAKREVEANDNSTDVFRTKAIQEMDAATTLRSNPEQSANFRVLLTAKVPSVLIELAYVSNAQDAKLLKSGEWRERVSSSIATAVENYFAAQFARLPM